MKKIITSAFAALLLPLLMGLSLASPASATPGYPGEPSADNKKVTLCHATSSQTNPYNKITVSVSAFFQSGHIIHPGDIYESFTYTTKRGNTVTVPARGDTSLLAFDDCKKPEVDKEIVVPDVQIVDVCGTEDDKVLVPPSDEYTSTTTWDGLVATVTFTANKGFVFPEGKKTVTRTFTFTDVDCDLPDTGVGASVNSTGGYLALGALGAGALVLVGAGRFRKTRTNA